MTVRRVLTHAQSILPGAKNVLTTPSVHSDHFASHDPNKICERQKYTCILNSSHFIICHSRKNLRKKVHSYKWLIMMKLFYVNHCMKEQGMHLFLKSSSFLYTYAVRCPRFSINILGTTSRPMGSRNCFDIVLISLQDFFLLVLHCQNDIKIMSCDVCNDAGLTMDLYIKNFYVPTGVEEKLFLQLQSP